MEQAGVSSSNVNNLPLGDGLGMASLFPAVSATAEAPGVCTGGGT